MYRYIKSAFTLIELVVVFVIIALLAALLLPAMSRMRWQTKRVTCVNNLRQIGVTLLLYADEHDEGLPLLLVNPEVNIPAGETGRYDASDIYPKYIDDYKVFHDPSWHDKNYCLENSGWPNSNTYAFFWTGNATVVTDSNGVIPASIKGGTYILVFCGSYSGCHGYMNVSGKYASYTGKNILRSDGAIAYVYANITETQGKTPRAIFNRPNDGGNNSRTWRW